MHRSTLSDALPARSVTGARASRLGALLHGVRRVLGAPVPRQLARALGISAAVELALLVSVRAAPPVVTKLTARLWNAKLAEEALWGRLTGADEKAGVSQFVAFIVVMAFVVGFALLYGVARARAERVSFLRWPARGADLGLAALAVVVAQRVTPFEGHLAWIGLGIGTATIAAFSGVAPEVPESSEWQRAAFVLVAEGVALAWGLWECASRDQGSMFLWVVFAMVAAACLRVGRARTLRDLRRDAFAATPLLLLPLLGLARDPSTKWCAAAAAVVVLAWLLLGLARRRLIFRSLPDALIAAAATSLSLLWWLPNRFRELPNENFQEHEGFHLGWISSASFGKFLFADAGFTYGPLREYLLTIAAWAIGGLRLDHVRLAHVALNTAGTALFLGAGWFVSGRRLWLFALWWYLLITRSPLAFFTDYPSVISLGWVDIARPATAAVVVVGAMAAAERFDGSRRSLRPLAAWGAGAGVATLYSPDSGIGALAAVALTLAADALLRRRGLTLREASLRGARVVGAFAAGAAVLLGGFIAIYVVCGRGRRLLDAWHLLAEFGSGTFGAAVFPLSSADFRSAETLYQTTGFWTGWRFDYVAPLILLVLGAGAVAAAIAYGRWSSRIAQTCALFLFSCALFRYALWRSDRWHITGGAIPAYLLLIALIAHATTLRVRFRASRRALFAPATLVFVGLALWTIYVQEGGGGLTPRAKRIAAGAELPSTGAAYSYGLPRAGDEIVSSATLTLATYIRDHTTRDQPIWIVTNFQTGGEYYFLADRRDATRYDVYAEAVTKREIGLAFEDLKRDPPILIVGHAWALYSQEITDYVNQNWQLVDKVSGVDIRRYAPGAGH